MAVGVLFRETRPQFLLLTPACLLVGLGTAAQAVGGLGEVPWGYAALAFLGGLFAHVAVNVLNDYFDFRSGLDLRTRRTPFSGGSGILPAGLMSPRGVLSLGLVALGVVVAVGIYFLQLRGKGILPLGLLGLLVVVLYTPFITRSPVACFIAPGLGFGPLMVLGMHYVLTGRYEPLPLWASLVPGLLVSNLLLINQFPDLEADRASGRYHLVIALGRRKAARLYALVALSAFGWLALAVASGLLPKGALLALLPLPLALRTVKGVLREAEDLSALMPHLGSNVLYTLLTPALLGTGLIVL